jgi:hypothetical protein
MNLIRLACFASLPVLGLVTTLAACSGDPHDEAPGESGSALQGLQTATQVGVFNGGTFHVDANGNHLWNAARVFGDNQYQFGAAGVTPLTFTERRWDPNRMISVPGYYSGGSFCFDGHNGADGGVKCTPMDIQGGIPLVFNSCFGFFKDGQWTIGKCFRNWNGVTMAFGSAGDTPVTGDWTGETSRDGEHLHRIGVFNAGIWALDTNGNGVWDFGDSRFSFGQAGDIPVVGDWAGDGRSRIGVFRAGTWYLDTNGNGVWDGNGVDSSFVYGSAGDIPVVGYWQERSDSQQGGVFVH